VEARFDWWSIAGGASFGIGSIPKIWPEIIFPHQFASIPPIVTDFPLRVFATIILAFVGGLSGMIAKDVYLYAKRRMKK